MNSTPQGFQKFSLRSLFAVIVLFAVASAFVRGVILRNAGQAHWTNVVKAASSDPARLKNEVDRLLKLQKHGRLILPESGFLVSEFRNSRQYLKALEKMSPAEYVDCVKQFEYMKSKLNLNDSNTTRPEQEIGLFAAEVMLAAHKVIDTSVSEIATELENGIASADARHASLNVLIDELALLKRELPALTWNSEKQGKFPESPTWREILRSGRTTEKLRTVLVPVILDDLKTVLADDQSLSTRLSIATLESYKTRVETLRWLCECPEDEFALPDSVLSELP